MYHGEKYARCYVSITCYCAFAHAFGMGAPHSSRLRRDTFPSRGRLWCAPKFHQHNTGSCFRRCPLSRTCRTSATKSPLGLFKENPTRIFFQGEPQSDCNRHEGSPSLRLWRKFTHTCVLRTQVGTLLGALPRHPASPLKRA